MELTNAAVHHRIADLTRLADELRLERTVHALKEAAGRAASPAPAAHDGAIRPTHIVGNWLIGLGAALGGNVASAGRHAGR